MWIYCHLFIYYIYLLLEVEGAQHQGKRSCVYTHFTATLEASRLGVEHEAGSHTMMSLSENGLMD